MRFTDVGVSANDVLESLLSARDKRLDEEWVPLVCPERTEVGLSRNAAVFLVQSSDTRLLTVEILPGETTRSFSINLCSGKHHILRTISDRFESFASSLPEANIYEEDDTLPTELSARLIGLSQLGADAQMIPDERTGSKSMFMRLPGPRRIRVNYERGTTVRASMKIRPTPELVNFVRVITSMVDC